MMEDISRLVKIVVRCVDAMPEHNIEHILSTLKFGLCISTKQRYDLIKKFYEKHVKEENRIDYETLTEDHRSNIIKNVSNVSYDFKCLISLTSIDSKQLERDNFLINSIISRYWPTPYELYKSISKLTGLKHIIEDSVNSWFEKDKNYYVTMDDVMNLLKDHYKLKLNCSQFLALQSIFLDLGFNVISILNQNKNPYTYSVRIKGVKFTEKFNYTSHLVKVFPLQVSTLTLPTAPKRKGKKRPNNSGNNPSVRRKLF